MLAKWRTPTGVLCQFEFNETCPTLWYDGERDIVILVYPKWDFIESRNSVVDVFLKDEFLLNDGWYQSERQSSVLEALAHGWDFLGILL